ncbi:gas vesicle protein [Streptomyces kunmingensis]|uniref:Gas vesicle protein n=1 Tax=Streptomyces kunmingensis TaxID=68225 RepID=A0ABU6CA81_9ACTN|nr:gas vesicle protein [Streptomyces kunmingensis]MEB3961608.1 gas vesicle protein [Streptomyces kunmingensis]
MSTASRFPDSPLGGGSSGANLADILERVLDKGIVIAGDIRINLLDIELLTIKLRLIVASIDKAKEMGIDWWEDDPALSSGARRKELARENAELRERLAALEGGGAAGALDEAPEKETQGKEARGKGARRD